MKDLRNIEAAFFVGIGGIGMSALARYFNSLGCRVYGYDRTSTALTMALESEGMEVIYQDDPALVPKAFSDTPSDKTLLVYTPAIPAHSALLAYFQSTHYHAFKRSEVLGMITAQSKVLAVAGTHGKTTTSCMLAHLLTWAGIPCNAFLGGISVNYDTNCILHPDAKFTVVEADEYDRSFLALDPYAAIVTSVDADHLDIYKTDTAMKEAFQLFADRVDASGVLAVAEGVVLRSQAKQIRYGIEYGDLQARNVHVENGAFVFDVYDQDVHKITVYSPYPGRHNVNNTLAAIVLARKAGIYWDDITDAMAEFKGVKRRFETHINRPDLVMIDDYAHHPTEISACINAVRELYPARRLTGVFQPHLYSRTRDFSDDFARSLEDLNELILMEIYPAREEPIAGVNSQMLLDKVRMVNKYLAEPSQVVDEVLRLKPELVLTMGAGDIDKLIAPLRDALNE